jgi:arginine:agmatine antiporter
MATDARQIGSFPATMLVAGNMIGSGIFMMPTVMASIGGIASLGWLIAVPGAFVIGYVFARLAQAQPKAGGHTPMRARGWEISPASSATCCTGFPTSSPT